MSIPPSIEEVLEGIRSKKILERTYRIFQELAPIAGDFPWYLTTTGKRVLNMSSNDYLGLSQNVDARNAAIQHIQNYGLGSGGSRNIGGTRPEHCALEDELSRLHASQDCLLYNSGNAANGDAISVIARILPQTIFFSDEENHASLIDPMRRLGDRKVVFRHNCLDDLSRAFNNNVKNRAIPVLVVESLYSMSGDWGEIEKICHWFKERDGIVIVNEVHAIGVCGPEGAGYIAELNYQGFVDVVIGSLSKAFGAMGGYIAGSSALVDAFRQAGVRSVFTTSLPGAIAAAALENVQRCRVDREPAQLLALRTHLLRRELDVNGVKWSGGEGSHITKIEIGSELLCQDVHLALLIRGYYATAIRYPTVPKGQAQLRVTVTSLHPEGAVIAFVKELAAVLSHTSRGREGSLDLADQ